MYSSQEMKTEKPAGPVHIEHVQEDQSDLGQEMCSKGACNTGICLSGKREEDE